MNPVRQKKLAWLLSALFGFAAVVALVLYALQEKVDHYYTPTQIKQGVAPINKRIRAGGVVVKGSILRSTHDPLKVTFSVTDLSATTNMVYQGILPDLFAEGSGVVATGQLKGDWFVAETVLAKHDENYMPPEVEKSLAK